MTKLEKMKEEAVEAQRRRVVIVDMTKHPRGTSYFRFNGGLVMYFAAVSHIPGSSSSRKCDPCWAGIARVAELATSTPGPLWAVYIDPSVAMRMGGDLAKAKMTSRSPRGEALITLVSVAMTMQTLLDQTPIDRRYYGDPLADMKWWWSIDERFAGLVFDAWGEE